MGNSARSCTDALRSIVSAGSLPPRSNRGSRTRSSACLKAMKRWRNRRALSRKTQPTSSIRNAFLYKLASSQRLNLVDDRDNRRTHAIQSGGIIVVRASLFRWMCSALHSVQSTAKPRRWRCHRSPSGGARLYFVKSLKPGSQKKPTEKAGPLAFASGQSCSGCKCVARIYSSYH